LFKETTDALELKRSLEELALLIRSIWLEICHKGTDYMKSPAVNQQTTIPTGLVLDYTCERNLRPRFLEERCSEYRSAPSLWEAEHVLFRSGQAAMATFLQVIVGELRRAGNGCNATPPKIGPVTLPIS